MKKTLLMMAVAVTAVFSSCSNDNSKDAEDTSRLVTVVPMVKVDRTIFDYCSRATRYSKQADIVAYCQSDESVRENSGSVTYLNYDFSSSENEFWEPCGSFSLNKDKYHNMNFIAIESFDYRYTKSCIDEDGVCDITFIPTVSQVYAKHLEHVTTDELNREPVLLETINSLVSIVLNDKLPEGCTLKVSSNFAYTFSLVSGGVTKWRKEDKLLYENNPTCTYNVIRSNFNSLTISLVDPQGKESEPISVFYGDSLRPIKANCAYIVNVYVDQDATITYNVNTIDAD